MIRIALIPVVMLVPVFLGVTMERELLALGTGVGLLVAGQTAICGALCWSYFKSRRTSQARVEPRALSARATARRKLAIDARHRLSLAARTPLSTPKPSPAPDVIKFGITGLPDLGTIFDPFAHEAAVRIRNRDLSTVLTPPKRTPFKKTPSKKTVASESSFHKYPSPGQLKQD